MGNGKQPTNTDIYKLINDMRLEAKADIVAATTTLASAQGRLEKKFDDLEAGRLTRLEGKYNDLAIKMVQVQGEDKVTSATISTKVAIIWTLLVVVGTALVSGIMGIVIQRLSR